MQRVGLLSLISGLALAVSVSANQVQVGYSGSSYGAYQSGVGGEFTLNVTNPAGWLDLSGYVNGVTKNVPSASAPYNSFETFCIEYNEHIYPFSKTYDVTIDTKAINGGKGGAVPGLGGDPVSQGTGWLYSQFAQGTLSGYSYDPDPSKISDRKTSAGLLQNAIWMLEQELVSGDAGYSMTNPFIELLLNPSGGGFANLTAAMADGAEKYGVYALNLWDAGSPHQDQLYFHVPDGGSTALLLGFGISGMALISRRNSQKHS